MRAAALLLVLGTLCFAAGPAFPRAVMVPDQVATIQGAIDTLSDGSHGPDTVLVRYGEYPEALFVAEVPGSEHTLVLLPFESVAPTMFGPRLRMPQIRSFQTSPRAQRINCTIQGFHFMGPIAYNDAIECTTLFEACRMDSSLQISGTDVFAHVRGCQIWNGARVQAHSIEFIGNTVIGGGLSCHDVGYAEISDNYIVGPADAGITELSTASSIGIEHNTVVGTTEGIVNACATVSDNLVMGCSGNAFHYYRCDWPTHSTNYDHNRAIRCGGHGFIIEEGAGGAGCRLLGNEVDSVGGCGVLAEGRAVLSVESNTIHHVGGSGIAGQNAEATPLQGNRITDVGGDGIVLHALDHASANVIGHCGGRGIAADEIYPPVGHNTIYACRGSGFVTFTYPPDSRGSTVSGSGSDTLWVEHNIFADNGGYGFDLVPAPPYPRAPKLALACNDWFGNTAGPVRGIPLGTTDLQVDPLFCRVDAESVGLMNDSPLLNALGCGLIGALGEGCIDLATGTLTPGGPKAPAEHFSLALLPPVPNPARKGARIAYTLPSEMTLRVKVLDVAGRVVAELVDGTQAAGRHEVVWGASTASARAGVYFVSLEAGGQRFLRRAIIVP